MLCVFNASPIVGVVVTGYSYSPSALCVGRSVFDSLVVSDLKT